MPTYGYRCTACKHEFEVFQKITDEAVRECPVCKGEVRRILFPVGIVFKGPGFHITDYRKPGKESGGDGHKEAASDAKVPEKSKKSAPSSSR